MKGLIVALFRDLSFIFNVYCYFRVAKNCTFFIAEIVYDAKPCIVGWIDFLDSETQANALSF